MANLTADEDQTDALLPKQHACMVERVGCDENAALRPVAEQLSQFKGRRTAVEINGITVIDHVIGGSRNRHFFLQIF